MGNTTAKESRQNSPNLGTSDLFSPSSRHRADRAGAQPHERRASHSSQGQHSPSKHHSSHHRSKMHGYRMLVDPNETVDGGFLFPQGVYHGTQDFKVSVVREMIIKRRLAPFYKGLDQVDPNWSDEELLAAVNSKAPLEEAEPATVDGAPAESGASKGVIRHSNPDAPGPPTSTQQIWLYRNVHECPICFLVYPRLNATRCCGQDICTECFVQIKRNPPHPPYTSIENSEATDVLDLISEPSCCPYCAQVDLGVIFEAPPFEWGIPSSGVQGSHSQNHHHHRQQQPESASQDADPSKKKTMTSQRSRRTSVPASHPSVVTVDMIRPDWEDKLASARRRLARKSAAARALHRSALISTEERQRGSSASKEPDTNTESQHRRTSNRQRRDSSLADIVEATRGMSAAQSRALEKKMIEEAIQASLHQN